MTTEIKDNRTGQIWRMLRASRLALFVCLTLPAALPATSLMAEELDKRFAVYDQTSSQKINHSAWNMLLRAYVTADRQGLNRIDYAGLKASGLGDLRKYLGQLQSVNPAKLSRDEQFAYWANLYNAKTMEIVADKYPVSSIRKIRLSLSLFPGPWRDKVLKVMGVSLSLDDIEHKILRPIWRDPRIHYAVNCASIGCPNLQDQAYTGSVLETMLEKAARDYINSPRGVRFDGTKVIVSSLYDWYGPDFGGSVPNILAHIRKYADPALAERIAGVKQFSDYEYDWALNERK